jgi:nucleotide sugar dehydrogenase
MPLTVSEMPSTLEPAPGRTAGAAPRPAAAPDLDVAVVGLGYVGLPTSTALSAAGLGVIGLDVNARRLADIRERRVDLQPAERVQLSAALGDPHYRLTTEPQALAAADTVLICVPTPVDAAQNPDLRAVRAACATVVAHARRGQTIVLTSTTCVGTTRELLAVPLAERGLRPGDDVFVAFAPERIDPGNPAHAQHSTPRVVGGVTDACAASAAAVLRRIAPEVVVVSSPEAAELTKLYENTYRAVNIALANEMAQVSRFHGLDPVEVTEAAATKPYGFLAHWPGPGVGGHCIPCDPHYLLAPLRAAGVATPVIEHAMAGIAERPARVVERVLEILEGAGLDPSASLVLVLGASYKPGVADVRGAPAVEILDRLLRLGVPVEYHDPHVPTLRLPGGVGMFSVRDPRAAGADLVVSLVEHPGGDHGWLREHPLVLDCTYRGAAGEGRLLI